MNHISIFMKVYKPQYVMLLEVSNYSVILLNINEIMNFWKNKIINTIM